MRISYFLLLSAAGVAGALIVAGERSESRPLPAAAVARPPVIKAISNGSRIMLESTQRREAASVGGFVQAPLSVLRIDRPMAYGDFVWNDAGVPDGPVSVRVDLRTQLLSVFRGGHEIGTAVVIYGADSKETPLGRFPILWKGKDHRSSLYDAPMPFTLRLTGDGIAIHGSEVRWGAATHGCIGVPTSFAKHLFGAVGVDDPVVIMRSEGKAGASNRA